MERAGRRQKAALRVLGIKPHLDRMAVKRDGVLPQRQCFTGRDADLPFDEIRAGDRLGDRVLDLQPRIHLHEIEILTVMLGDELDSAGADITDRARRGDRHLAELVALSVAEPRRRRLLDDLLMAALDRAVALPEVHDVALRIPKHLYLDMARPFEIALEE